MKGRPLQLIVSCEHAGNEVPRAYREHFKGHEHHLPTHRGWDPGALILAREICKTFDAPLYATTTTRLLIDANRSVGNPALHGEMVRDLPQHERRVIVSAYYQPHRDAIEGAVADAIKSGASVIHVSSHSFTPALNGVVRTADVGFLYDPARPGEIAFSTAWLDALKSRRLDLRLRRNYPYLGKEDGLTTTLRRRHGVDRYVGIELEVNQRYIERGGSPWTKIRKDLIASLGVAVVGYRPPRVVAPTSTSA